MGFQPYKGQWDFHVITLSLSYRVSIQEHTTCFKASLRSLL